MPWIKLNHTSKMGPPIANSIMTNCNWQRCLYNSESGLRMRRLTLYYRVIKTKVLRPRKNGRHFADWISICIVLNENVRFPMPMGTDTVRHQTILQKTMPLVSCKRHLWLIPGKHPVRHRGETPKLLKLKAGNAKLHAGLIKWCQAKFPVSIFPS